VFLAAITGALLRWLVLAPHPVLFAKIHIYFRSSASTAQLRGVEAYHEQGLYR
jgi:hypothetical protein